jgi:hypothetical protein
MIPITFWTNNLQGLIFRAAKRKRTTPEVSDAEESPTPEPR